MSRLFKDNDDKNSLLIKIAYNISLDELEKEFGITKKQIINIRKNNYKTYNSFVDHFTILDEIAILGFNPVFEFALNICKKAYRDKFKILGLNSFLFKGEYLSTTEVINLANSILARDELPPISSKRIIINKYYIPKVKRCRKTK